MPAPALDSMDVCRPRCTARLHAHGSRNERGGAPGQLLHLMLVREASQQDSWVFSPGHCLPSKGKRHRRRLRTWESSLMPHFSRDRPSSSCLPPNITRCSSAGMPAGKVGAAGMHALSAGGVGMAAWHAADGQTPCSRLRRRRRRRQRSPYPGGPRWRPSHRPRWPWTRGPAHACGLRGSGAAGISIGAACEPARAMGIRRRPPGAAAAGPRAAMRAARAASPSHPSARTPFSLALSALTCLPQATVKEAGGGPLGPAMRRGRRPMHRAGPAAFRAAAALDADRPFIKPDWQAPSPPVPPPGRERQRNSGD